MCLWLTSLFWGLLLGLGGWCHSSHMPSSGAADWLPPQGVKRIMQRPALTWILGLVTPWLYSPSRHSWGVVTRWQAVHPVLDLLPCCASVPLIEVNGPVFYLSFDFCSFLLSHHPLILRRPVNEAQGTVFADLIIWADLFTVIGTKVI